MEKAGVDFVDPQQAHFANFIDCVRSRKSQDLHAQILEGHRTSMLAQLGNISYRLGTDVPLLHPIEGLGNDMALGEAWGSMKQHLVDAANMNLDQSMCRLGRKLRFDAQAEKFVDDEEANKLLTRCYRKPYVVPEQV